jgi:hypothetical protein
VERGRDLGVGAERPGPVQTSEHRVRQLTSSCRNVVDMIETLAVSSEVGSGRTRRNAVRRAALAFCATFLLVPAATAIAHVPSAPSEGVAPPTDTAVRLGSSGERVLQLQNVLRSLGYVLEVDGHFGRVTAARVKEFQSSRRLRVDGIVGPNTAAALGLPAPVTSRSSSSVTPPSPAAAPAAAASYRHPVVAVERWHAVAVASGWPEQDWKRLSCIIHRESGGRADARNASSAAGLLQIMWSAHGSWIGGPASQLLDGATNLRLGRQVFERAGGWSPWSSTIRGC